MKTLFNKLEAIFADAALLEHDALHLSSAATETGAFKETLEENLVEIAFAEAADFDDIHSAIQLEHRMHDNLCFGH